MTTLTRQTFRFSGVLEYFTEKELTLQTGHTPERWPEVVLKELIDNALDACSGCKNGYLRGGAVADVSTLTTGGRRASIARHRRVFFCRSGNSLTYRCCLSRS